MLKLRFAIAALVPALGACSSQAGVSNANLACTISATGSYDQTAACDVKATAVYYVASGRSVLTFGYGNNINDGVAVVVRFAGAPAVASYPSNASGVQGGVTAAHHMDGVNVLWRALAGGGLNSGGFGFAFSQVDVAMQWPDSVKYVVHGNLSGTLEPYPPKQGNEKVIATF